MKRKAYVWVVANSADGEADYAIFPAPPVCDNGRWHIGGTGKRLRQLRSSIVLNAGSPKLPPGGGPVKCEIILKPVKGKRK